nr:hypothetical protein CFP56_19083 [Quercus suber]
MYQPSCSLHLFAATAKDRLDEFLSIPTPRPTPPRQRIQWQASPQGMVMINFNGAISTKTLSSGIGVVHDDSGSVLDKEKSATTTVKGNEPDQSDQPPHRAIWKPPPWPILKVNSNDAIFREQNSVDVVLDMGGGLILF